MAIKIPSKNIYEINNPKIRDNIIDNVSVEQTIVKPNNEYEVSVYNEKIENLNINQSEFETDIDYSSSTQYSTFIDVATYISANKYTINGTIIIPKIKNNSFISKIYYGKNENNENHIKHIVIYDIYRANSQIYVTPTQLPSGTFNYEVEGYQETSSFEKIESSKHSISETLIDSVTAINDKGYPYSPISSKSEITLVDDTNLGDIIINEYENYYIFTYTIYVGGEHRKLSYKGSYTSGSGDIPSKKLLVGETYIYKPVQVEITLYGNTIGIDLTDGSVTYGSGNKPFLLSGNELMQHKETINYANVKGFSYNGAGLTINGNENNLLVVNGTCVVPSGTVGRYHINLGVVSLPKGKYILKGMPKAIGRSALILHNTKVGTIAESFYEPIEFSLEEQQDLTFYFVVSDGNIFNNFIIAPEIININNSEYLANNILNQYANGKETATLLCDISDYYDESGEKVIDIKTNKMSFRLHDEVIPYVYGADGKDKPMSKKQDGSAKVFEVVGSNIIYDGAVWQELTLLEKTQNN